MESRRNRYNTSKKKELSMEKETRTSDMALVKISGVSSDETKKSLRVTIVDLDMPLMSMVNFMVKWAIAAIPAFVILTLIAVIVVGFLKGLQVH